ncbi:MAG: hypothetical protein QG604_363 [Candidatus Dependentiae bacterium]|nr:hypothetical protein [Candidatus Dependentiae bacterium]
MNKKIVLALTLFTLVGQQAYGATATPAAVTTAPVKKGSLDLNEVTHYGTAKMIYGALGLGGSIVALQKLKAKIADTQAKIKALRDADTNADNEVIDTEAVENDGETESNDQPEETLAQLEANLSKYVKLKLLSSFGIGLGFGMLMVGFSEQSFHNIYDSVKKENDTAGPKDTETMEVVEIFKTDRTNGIKHETLSNNPAVVNCVAKVIADGRRSSTVRMLAPFKSTPTAEDEEKARKVLDYRQALDGQIFKKK